jgi:hypothetical protein
VTSSSGSTIHLYLPDPSAYVGFQLTVFNSAVGPVNLITPSGIFVIVGSNSTTLTIASGRSAVVVANGEYFGFLAGPS